MGETEKRCGTCKWAEQSRHWRAVGEGALKCFAPVPDAIKDTTKQFMQDTDGETCPCWMQKQPAPDSGGRNA